MAAVCVCVRIVHEITLFEDSMSADFFFSHSWFRKRLRATTIIHFMFIMRVEQTARNR